MNAPFRRRCFARPGRVLAAIACSALATPYAAARPKRARIEVQGHRGARARRPENTLEAFRYAIRAGVDTLELDVNVTRDDVLVVIHDQHIPPDRCERAGGRPLGRRVAIRTLTAEQVAKIRCGRHGHPRFPKQRPAARPIPTLVELLRAVRSMDRPRAKRVHFNIELKSVPGQPELTAPPAKLAKLLVAILRAQKVVGRTTVQSFDYRTLAAVRALEKRLKLVLLTGENHPDYVALARHHHAAIVSPHRLWVTARDVRRLHAAGVEVVPWTANDERSWRRLVAMGVDGIITDDPAGLIRYLKRRGLR